MFKVIVNHSFASRIRWTGIGNAFLASRGFPATAWLSCCYVVLVELGTGTLRKRGQSWSWHQEWVGRDTLFHVGRPPSRSLMVFLSSCDGPYLRACPLHRPDPLYLSSMAHGRWLPSFNAAHLQYKCVLLVDFVVASRCMDLWSVTGPTDRVPIYSTAAVHTLLPMPPHPHPSPTPVSRMYTASKTIESPRLRYGDKCDRTCVRWCWSHEKNGRYMRCALSWEYVNTLYYWYYSVY